MKPLLSRFALPVLFSLAAGYATSASAQQLAALQPSGAGFSLPSGAGFSLPSGAGFSSSILPDAPAPQGQYTTAPRPSDPDQPEGQSKRIFGILPNFRAVNADVHLPPQTVKEKFITATQDSFDYSSIFIPVAVAAYDYVRNSTPEFGTGGVAYGRYLWHSALDQTSENYFVEFIVPAATHEDTRYYSLARGGFVKRATYSLTRAVITRKDSGGSTVNLSEILGAGAAAGVSNLYYPSRERTFGNTAGQWATDIGIDALSFLVKEFSPDITHSVRHRGKVSHNTD